MKINNLLLQTKEIYEKISIELTQKFLVEYFQTLESKSP
jgi:hypothetical protein